MSETGERQGAERLFIVQTGQEACNPAYAYGPSVRDHYLIHFVESGEGTLYCHGQEYPVHAGQGFLILPGEETLYQASATAPWVYSWVGYRGREAARLTSAAGLDAVRRIFTAADPQAAWQALALMREDVRSLRLAQMAAVGDLLRFMSLIAPPQDPDAPADPLRQYCEKAVWYLEGNFGRDVSIQETADFVGLSRSHLYRAMMTVEGCSPKDMLQRIRMRHAQQLLKESSLTLEQIATRIGLRTGAQLGVAFRKMLGMLPGQYRRSSR